MVGMLLYRRADANETDEDGWIALSRAASKGHEAVVRQLVKYGAIVNAKSNYGETALHQAAFISVPDDHLITSCLHNAYISLDNDRLVLSRSQTFSPRLTLPSR